MKESMWAYLIVTLGIVIIAVLFLVQRLTTTDEQDYYLSREIMKASMYDAIDQSTYMKTGKLVMSKEKFVAVFTRRFAESVNADRTYELSFYDIHEYPPKATIRINTKSGETAIKDDAVNLEINTFITGILETTNTAATLDDDIKTTFVTSFGDMDNNGVFNSEDAKLIKEYIEDQFKYVEVTNIQYKDYATRADLNGDGEYDEADYVIAMRALYSGVPYDVNQDGVFNRDDAEYVQKSLDPKNDIVLTDMQKILADANNDGKITVMDVGILYALQVNK